MLSRTSEDVAKDGMGGEDNVGPTMAEGLDAVGHVATRKEEIEKGKLAADGNYASDKIVIATAYGHVWQ